MKTKEKILEKQYFKGFEEKLFAGTEKAVVNYILVKQDRLERVSSELEICVHCDQLGIIREYKLSVFDDDWEYETDWFLAAENNFSAIEQFLTIRKCSKCGSWNIIFD